MGQSPKNLQYQFLLIEAIRSFFKELDFTEVLTPPMVENPGMETHIHPFATYSVRHKKTNNMYLHTSPEFAMKGLLAEGFERIYQISYCFRDEPNSPHHRSQFLMLEWYRSGERYEKIMGDTENLISHCHTFLKNKKVENLRKIETTVHKTVEELFSDILNIKILDHLEKTDLLKLLKADFPKLMPQNGDNFSWDDLFFHLFLNHIEPKFVDYPSLLLKEFPAPLAALSTLKESDQRVCERFEVYLNGLELCNCFNELTNYSIQKDRFDKQSKEKNDLYGYNLSQPNDFYNTLKNGLPESSGNALGVERLLLSLVDIDNPFFI